MKWVGFSSWVIGDRGIQRDFSKPNFGGYFEAATHGFALIGENKTTCAKGERFEETDLTTATNVCMKATNTLLKVDADAFEVSYNDPDDCSRLPGRLSSAAEEYPGCRACSFPGVGHWTERIGRVPGIYKGQPIGILS